MEWKFNVPWKMSKGSVNTRNVQKKQMTIMETMKAKDDTKFWEIGKQVKRKMKQTRETCLREQYEGIEVYQKTS